MNVILALLIAQTNGCTFEEEQAITSCAAPLYSLGAIQPDQSETLTWHIFTEKSRDYLKETCA